MGDHNGIMIDGFIFNRRHGKLGVIQKSYSKQVRVNRQMSCPDVGRPTLQKGN